LYATLAVVHSGQRFTLAMIFVWAGETMNVVLARELGVRFKRLYCDKGFCWVAVLRLLRQRRVPYLIPIPAQGGVRGIKGLFYGRRSYSTCYTSNRGRHSYGLPSIRRQMPGGNFAPYPLHPGRWWYTQRKLRAVRSLLKNSAPHLFTWILLPGVPRTTNHVEGGINSKLKDLFRIHRGIPAQKKIALTAWYLYHRQSERKSTRNMY
jgi:hypothetical protein